jgi:hypothetical protein
MEKKSSQEIVKRLIKQSVVIQVLILVVIFLFTKTIFYSIIFFLGSILSILGFLTMIKVIDRILRLGKGQFLFYLAGLLKVVVITALVYLIARFSQAENSVLFFILGLSVLVMAITVEGVYQLYRSVVNGRT